MADDVYVAVSLHGDMYRACCDGCGWRGTWLSSRVGAGSDARQHVCSTRRATPGWLTFLMASLFAIVIGIASGRALLYGDAVGSVAAWVALVIGFVWVQLARGPTTH